MHRQCVKGHEWEATPYNIKRGTWCPLCSQGIGKRFCRKYFELIFRQKFPKKKRVWLRNNNGNLMELDGYCSSLNIGFEYQGRQHYEYVKHFHQSQENLEKRRSNDKLKKKLCSKNNVILIEVPYTIEYENMGDYIFSECTKRNIPIPTPKMVFGFDSIVLDVYSNDKIHKLKKLAKEKGDYVYLLHILIVKQSYCGSVKKNTNGKLYHQTFEKVVGVLNVQEKIAILLKKCKK